MKKVRHLSFRWEIGASLYFRVISYAVREKIVDIEQCCQIKNLYISMNLEIEQVIESC